MKFRFGAPTQCRLCLRFAAFATGEGAADLCVSCKTSLAQFGNPVPCDQCRAVRAFHKSTESRAKVGGAVLCFSCTKRHKDAARQKSASSSTATAAKRDFSAVSSSSTARSSTTATTSATKTSSSTSSTTVVKRSRSDVSSPSDPAPRSASEWKARHEKLSASLDETKASTSAKLAQQRDEDAAIVARLNHDVSVAQTSAEANAKRIEERNAQLVDVEKQKAQLHAQIAKATDERAQLKARWNELARQVSEVRRALQPLATQANSIYDTEAIERLKLAMKSIRVRTTGSGSMKYRSASRRLRLRQKDRDDKFSGAHTRRDAMEPIDEEKLVQDENEACTAANMLQNDLSSGEEACAMLRPFLLTEQQRVNYLQARNTVLLEWHKNPSVQLLLDDIAGDVLDEHLPVLEAAYSYLNRYGVINVGVYARKREPARKEGERIVVIGAGFAGLTAARQLRSFGYDVVVLEGRDEVGGRCRSDTSFDTVGNGGAVDLGASIVTGTEGNPLTWLIRQLKVPTHLIRNECPQHGADGRAIDGEFDDAVSGHWDGLLQFVSEEVKNKPGSEETSLGGSMRRALRESGLDAEQERHMWWYWSNLEYACASNLDNVSLNHWDQDDEWMLEGDHLLLERGFASLLKPLAQGTDVRFGQVVERVELRGDSVRVHVHGADAPLVATRCVLTPSLGVLKSGALAFEPPLPAPKLAAIQRLGFGVLNKVVLLFDEVFWSNSTDYFGHSSGDEATRGWYYIFWNLCLAMKSPVLIALVTGDAAEQVEARDEREVVSDVVGVLRRIYGAERVRDPLRSTVTKWRSDPFARGSYSYIAVGATGADIDALAEPVDNRLFFAGEATSRTHPATTTGAMMTGLAQAGLIDEIVCNNKKQQTNKH